MTSVTISCNTTILSKLTKALSNDINNAKKRIFTITGGIWTMRDLNMINICNINR